MTSEALIVVAEQALSAAIGNALRRVLNLRAEQAFADLMDELRLEKITPESAAADDKTAARMLAFFAAMSQGAARRNLRVMAQIIARRAAYPLQAEDDFLSWSNTIAGLRREEVILLATFHRHQVACMQGLGPDPNADERHEKMLDTNRLTKEELIGPEKPFKTESAFMATAHGLTRTALLIDYPVLDFSCFQTTTLMVELAEMIRLDQWADEALAGLDFT